jgi:archaellum component FlaC
MPVKEAVLAALKELVLPELAGLRQEQGELKTSLALVNQRLEANNQRLDDINRRLDDVNAHLIDQSRRIDAVREELGGRIDAVREGLGGRIDAVREELGGRIDETNKHIVETNKRLDRLYEVIVRREEHQDLSLRVRTLEQEVADLKRHLAA